MNKNQFKPNSKTLPECHFEAFYTSVYGRTATLGLCDLMTKNKMPAKQTRQTCIIKMFTFTCFGCTTFGNTLAYHPFRCFILLKSKPYGKHRSMVFALDVYIEKTDNECFTSSLKGYVLILFPDQKPLLK